MSLAVRLALAALAALLSLASIAKAEDDKVIMCYVIQWSVYRRSSGQFSMSNIDPSLCTHLVYAYLGIDGTDFTVKSRDLNGESNVGKRGLLRQIVDWKKTNPNLRVLFSVGGWSEGSINYSKMVADQRKRAAFISSVLEFIRLHKFDGLDVGWWNPGERGGTADDRDNLVLLLKELRDSFDPLGYELTAQVEGRQHLIDIGYNVAEISKYVHYMNIFTFQYKTPWDMLTGANAPLNSTDAHNVIYSINYLIEKGASPRKMLLGMPTYGHPFQISGTPSAPNKYMKYPSNDIIQGKWSTEGGFIGYNEVCDDVVNTRGWTEYWDDDSSTPFAVKGNTFYSYDNAVSFQEKLKLVFRHRLAGAMVMSLDTDDFTGACYGEKFPLTKSIKNFFTEHKGKGPNNPAFTFAFEKTATTTPEPETTTHDIQWLYYRPGHRPGNRNPPRRTTTESPEQPDDNPFNVVVISHPLVDRRG